MAEAGSSSIRFRSDVQRACSVIAVHGAVREVTDPLYLEAGAQVTVTVEVPLPNAWKAQGQSPNGVKRLEEVRLDFPLGFPLDPPEPSLRPEFRRDLAHMQPWMTRDGRPVPCIQDGRMSEFIHQEGIRGVINQTVLWLEHAAEGRLIDPKQGWEPTRRDQLLDFIIADDDALRKHVDTRGGFKFLKYEYLRGVNPDGSYLLHGEVIDTQVALNKEAAKSIFSENPFGREGNLFFGTGLALLVWPGKQSSGQPVVCGTYAPEDVTDLASLTARAVLYGCAKNLSDGLSRLASCVRGYNPAGPFNLTILFLVRRPFNLIGKTTPIELCGYFLDFNFGDAFPKGDATPVQPAGHRNQISPALLARLAGIDGSRAASPWALIGAGSLGSKLAIHMARAGRAPGSVIDNSTISPHNAARHALIPPSGDMQIRFMETKARLLADAIKGFSQTATPLNHDAVNVINTRSLAKQAWPKGTWAIVNTTASLRVRSALIAAGDNLRGRVIESLLYGAGRIGLIATEGPDRNPALGDLFSRFYASCRTDSRLRAILFGQEAGGLERTAIGQGCGSATMPMSDGRLSLFGAAAAEYLLSRQRDGLPQRGGELLIGVLEDNGLGVSWRHLEVPPFVTFPTGNGERWAVRISAEAASTIEEEVSRWPRDETGGVLLGRQDEVSRTFHVVDVLPPPPDSVRSPNEFVLGTQGLRRAIDEYSAATDWALYCLGTWHSHLSPSGPSQLDRHTARAVGLARIAPSVLIIHTPDGYRALLADGRAAGAASQ